MLEKTGFLNKKFENKLFRCKCSHLIKRFIYLLQSLTSQHAQQTFFKRNVTMSGALFHHRKNNKSKSFIKVSAGLFLGLVVKTCLVHGANRDLEHNNVRPFHDFKIV